MATKVLSSDGDGKLEKKHKSEWLTLNFCPKCLQV